MRHRALVWTSGIAAAAAVALSAAPGRAQPEPAIAYLSGNRLHVMNEDGSNAAQVYGGLIPNGPNLSWSPDGASIAFIESLGGFSLSRIDVTVVDGVPRGVNRIVLLADPGTPDSYWAPAWSPLGDEVVFAGITTGSLMAIPAAGGAPQTILTPPAGRKLTRPAWSPDGAFVAFYEDFDNSELGTIGVLERDTGIVTTILGPQTLAVHELDWGRTQDILAMDAGVGGTWGTYLLAVAPGATPQLIRPTALGPSWAPDDSALVIWEPKNPTKRVNSGNPYMVKRLNPTTGGTVTLVPSLCPDWRR